MQRKKPWTLREKTQWKKPWTLREKTRRNKLLSERIALECSTTTALVGTAVRLERAISAASLIVKDLGRKVVKAAIAVRGLTRLDSLDASASMNAKELVRLTVAAQGLFTIRLGGCQRVVITGTTRLLLNTMSLCINVIFSRADHSGVGQVDRSMLLKPHANVLTTTGDVISVRTCS